MRKVEGSMTVEASLLMPMVIFILAGLCYSFFFMHDYIVMQNEGYRRTEAELWHRETEEDMPVFMMSVLLVALDNFDGSTTLTAVFATFNNIGPGLGMVGPTGSYAAFSPLSKIVLCLDMLFGRLELYPMLVLFYPGTWRRK